MIRALARLLPYIRRVQRDLVLGLICILVATGLSLASPWLLKDVIDGLVRGEDRLRLGLYALAIVGLAVADGAFRYLMRTQLIGASRQIEYELRREFFAHLTRLPHTFFQANRTGDLMSRAINDLSAVRMMVGPALMYFASTALGFVVAVVIMWSIDARLTLLALLPLPGVTVGTRYFGQAIHDRFERIQAQLSDMSAVVQEALSGIRVVRAYRQEPHELGRFEEASEEYVRRQQSLIRLQSAFYPTLTLCFGLSGLLVLWFGGRDVMRGTLTLGEFVAFSRYLVLLSWPLIAFGWVINLVQRGVASLERMEAVLDAPVADSGTATEWSGTPVRGRIEARGLSFRYAGADRDALHDVSFTLEPGQALALVGETGAGKSTFVHLLTRLHEPPAGVLFLDDEDVRTLPLSRLRACLAVVPQEAFLFSDTVRDNIQFGVEDAERDADARGRVEAAADVAALTGDVTRFAHGFDTMVGERGVTLSGGQKQRAALARALVTDRPVLILDDTLSAVDTATEAEILHRLRDIRRSRTCVIVAHRLSTVRDADVILVLSHGRVVERGTHASLVAAKGVYADLYRRQQLEEELAGV